jgi:hypothetical protein
LVRRRLSSAPRSTVGSRRPIPRALGLFAIALAFVVGVVTAHGCVDDRKQVREGVFYCNPESRTADEDCGTGYVCYHALQALGGSICVKRCDPGDPSTCDGACTESGACLQRCTVPAMDSPDPCPEPLLCRRTTISPLEAKGGNDGVCLPVNSICSTAQDCTSPIFTTCSSFTSGARQGPGLLTTGEVCLQGNCRSRNIACLPGSACVPNLLPPEVPSPDVCSPVCTPARDRTPGVPFNECAPGLTCLSDSFPEIEAPVCAPGFPGWLCTDSLGCTAGGCFDWSPIDPRFTGFKTCAPQCESDVECMPYDRSSNPNAITHNTCMKGRCRSLSSLFFPMTCLGNSSTCALLPEAKCVAPPASDMGTGGGLGAFGGQTSMCVQGCSTRDDCLGPERALHVPFTCGSVNGVPACVPIVPFVTDCKDDRDCYGDLTCLTVSLGGTTRQTCTRRCTSSDDCAMDDALGGSFTCTPANVCTPRLQAGDLTPGSELCLSGISIGGICKSPTGWACTADAQCANGQCNFLANVDPPFGRCN